MEHACSATAPPVRFETHPSRYVHWKLEIEPPLARLVDGREGGRGRCAPDYPLKLNSYDLGVDIELADAIQRLRFEHPEVRAVVVTSGKDRVFCSGANIYMLGSLDPRLQGELLQVHERDAPLPRGRLAALRPQVAGRA